MCWWRGFLQFSNQSRSVCGSCSEMLGAEVVVLWYLCISVYPRRWLLIVVPTACSGSCGPVRQHQASLRGRLLRHARRGKLCGLRLRSLLCLVQVLGPVLVMAAAVTCQTGRWTFSSEVFLALRNAATGFLREGLLRRSLEGWGCHGCLSGLRRRVVFVCRTLPNSVVVPLRYSFCNPKRFKRNCFTEPAAVPFFEMRSFFCIWSCSGFHATQCRLRCRKTQVDGM